MTTSPQVWSAALAQHAVARHALPPMPVEGGRLVVVAAHPDDETLGTGGFLQAARAAGARIEVVVATDGEAAFGAPDAELGRTRWRELHEALGQLGLDDVPVHRLGLPDSGLAGCHDELVAALTPLLAGAHTALAPWTGDPHPDHAAAGHAVLAAAAAATHRWTYPIWTLPWSTPEEQAIPWPHAAVFTLDASAAAAKRRAVSRFASQVGGPAPILAAEVLAHFDSGQELFFRVPRTASAPVSRFADLYGGGGDPWQTRTSWYERRKRDVVLACLPRPRYRHAAEPGCGLGLLTAGLAARCDRVTASDPVAEAADAARQLAADNVAVLPAALPDGDALPDDADLVVLSEVLYYLSADDAAQVADRIPTGADVVLVHWRGWPAEAPRDAAATHRQLTDDPRFATLVEHVDESFLLHVLRRR